MLKLHTIQIPESLVGTFTYGGLLCKIAQNIIHINTFMSVYAYTYTHAYISTYVCQAISAYNWNQKQQKNGDKLKKKQLSKSLPAFTNKSIFSQVSFQMLIDGQFSFQISTYMTGGSLKQASDPINLPHSTIKAL